MNPEWLDLAYFVLMLAGLVKVAEVLVALLIRILVALDTSVGGGPR